MEQQHAEHNIDKDYTDEFVFLYQLQDSGATNMFGAPPFLEEEFGYSREKSMEIFTAWSESWNEEDFEEATL